MTVKTFGPEFSRAWRDMGSDFAPHLPPGVAHEWTACIWALESGWNPAAENKHTRARGLWQKMPARAKDGSLVPYAVTDPAQQVRDYTRFTLEMWRTFGVQRVSSLGAMYVTNLMPARLRDPRPEAILFAADLTRIRDPRGRQSELTAARWPTAYEQNAYLDGDRKGWVEIRDLEPKLLKARAACTARIEAELAALLAVDTAA